MGEPKQLRDLVGVHEVVNVYFSAHEATL